jgi:hypothetical protein
LKTLETENTKINAKKTCMWKKEIISHMCYSVKDISDLCRPSMPLKTLGNHHHDFYLLNKVGR